MHTVLNITLRNASSILLVQIVAFLALGTNRSIIVGTFGTIFNKTLLATSVHWCNVIQTNIAEIISTATFAVIYLTSQTHTPVSRGDQI